MHDLKRTHKLLFLIKEIWQTAPLTGLLTFATVILKAGCYWRLIFLIQSFTESLCIKDTFSLSGVVLSVVTLFFLLALTSLMLKIFTKLASDALTYKFSTSLVKENLSSPSLDNKKKGDLSEEYQSLKDSLTRDIKLVVFGLEATGNTLAIGLYLFYLFPPAVVILFSSILFNLLLTTSKSSTKEQTRKTESANKLTALFYDPDSLLEMKLFLAGDFFQQKWFHFEETLFKEKLKTQEEELFLKGQGDILTLLMYLVSLVVMGYYFFQDRVTLGSLLAIGIFGRQLQKEAIKTLRAYFLSWSF